MKTILTFEHFEAKALEARKLLYETYIELIKFEEENSEYVEMGEINFYSWKTNERRKIEAKSFNCSSYLEKFNKGDFESCHSLLDKRWYKEPSLINQLNVRA